MAYREWIRRGNRVPTLRALMLVFALSGFALSVASPDRWTQAPPDRTAAVQGSRAKPANLKVLPKDISSAALDGLMHEYGEELGVKCGFCHAVDLRTGRFDYASDENPRKDTARVMIAMLRDINTKYLAQLGDPSYPVLVTCGNCHQGRANPPDFLPGAAALSQR